MPNKPLTTLVVFQGGSVTVLSLHGLGLFLAVANVLARKRL